MKQLTCEICGGKLIGKAGGILQGMSGSPLIQNAQFIGSVKKVLLEEHFFVSNEHYGSRGENLSALRQINSF